MTEPTSTAALRGNTAQPQRVRRSLKGRILHGLMSRLFSSRAYRIKQNWWNSAWQDKSQPESFAEAIPDALKTAVWERWAEPTAKVLDIGCGGGELSAWLDGEGYCVKGVDYSEAAIDKAREWFSQECASLPLNFEVLDICKPLKMPVTETYGLILDKGCFHGIPQNFRRQYVENLVALSEPGTRFIMFIRLDENKAKTQSMIAHYFSPWFDIESFEEDTIRRVAGKLDITVLPSLTLKMRRR